MRAFFLLLCIFLFSFPAVGEDFGNVLRVEMKDGTTHEYVLAEKPRISYVDEKVVFLYRDISTEFQKADVGRFVFVNMETNIDNMKAGDTCILSWNGESLFIKGLSETMQIKVFSFDGLERQASVIKSNYNVEVSLVGFPSGCYVVLINNKQSIKVIKK